MRVALLGLLAACGRIGFADRQRATDAAGDGVRDAIRDAPADARPDVPLGVIGYDGPFAQQHPGAGATDTFATTAIAGDLVLLQVSCSTTMAAPTNATVSANGWTFSVMSSSPGVIGLNSYSFRAIAPATGPVTVTVTWTGSTCDDGKAELGDEFEHAFGVDNAVTIAGTGDCAMTMQTHFANEAVWAACFSETTLLSVGAGYTKGADDAGGDWAEYKLTSDPIGTQETATFQNSNVPYQLSGVTIEAM